jgi:hypothetical protein
MRCALFMMFLSAGTLGFGQAGPAAPPTPFGQEPSPQQTWQGHDFGRLPTWHWDPSLSTLRSSKVVLPPSKQAIVPLGDASVDPQIVRHPSQRSLGTLLPGTQVAQNLFPGLTFQPIEDQRCAPASGPLSTIWPQLEMKQIPITWQNLKMEPVDGLGQAASAAVPGPHP